jgi:hypothetical protein
MTGQRIKTGSDIYPGFLCSSTYALVRVCCWLLCARWFTHRIGLVEPATGCMVCLTVQYRADRHTHVGIVALGLLHLSYSYSSLGAIRLLLHAGVCTASRWQAGTPRTVCLQ